jgi:hypothetical protein
VPVRTVLDQILTKCSRVNKLILNNSRADIYLHYVQNFSSYLSENTFTSNYKNQSCVRQKNCTFLRVIRVYPSEMLLNCREFRAIVHLEGPQLYTECN